MSFASGKSWRDRGGAVRIQPVSSRMLAAMPQLLLVIGHLEVRYLAGDAKLLCSSILGDFDPTGPSTF